MKAYVLNLDGRTDRLAHMRGLMEAEGLDWQRVPAVRADDPAVAAAAAAVAPGKSGRRMSVGAYAIHQSHREAWRRLVGSGAPAGLVFEDDVVFAPGVFRERADLIPDLIPDGADIVKLETYAVRTHLEAGPGIAAGPRRLKRLRAGHDGAAGYALTAAAAARLLARTEAIRDPVDETVFGQWLGDFGVLQMTPAPVIQGDRLGLLGREVPDWAASSVAARAAGGDVIRPETPLGRLLRRAREEIRARALGTEYVVVPHG